MHQAYGRDCQLPNLTAYNETCATIGYAMYLGGVFASAVLGINMVGDLREYIRYADDPAF